MQQANLKPISAGLAFLQAAANAMPRTLGDRERIKAMSDVMSLAVHNRFAFDIEDAPKLDRLGIETCVGVFRPLSYYLGACIAGGTYPRMWEAHHKQKPWIARKAIVPGHLTETRNVVIEDNNRISKGMGVLLPMSVTSDLSEILTYDGQQVWWCTSQDNETIVLCRYRTPDAKLGIRPSAVPFAREGSPVRIRKVTRQEWADLNPKLEKTEPVPQLADA